MTHAIAEAIGLDGEIKALCAKNPQVVVFSTPKYLTTEGRIRLAESWKSAVAGTALDGVKAILLEDGMQISIVDKVEDVVQ